MQPDVQLFIRKIYFTAAHYRQIVGSHRDRVFTVCNPVMNREFEYATFQFGGFAPYLFSLGGGPFTSDTLKPE